MAQREPITAETAAVLRAKFSESERFAEGIFEESVRVRRRNEEMGSLPYAKVHNVIEFVGLLTLDLSCGLDDLVTHSGRLRTCVYARNLALLMLESTRTMESLLGRDFRAELVSALGDPAAEKAAKAAHKGINRVFRAAFDQFGPIRDDLIAHKSRSAERRAVLLEDVDPDAVLRTGGDLIIAMNPLLALIYRFLSTRARDLGLSAA